MMHLQSKLVYAYHYVKEFNRRGSMVQLICVTHAHAGSASLVPTGTITQYRWYTPIRFTGSCEGSRKVSWMIMVNTYTYMSRLCANLHRTCVVHVHVHVHVHVLHTSTHYTHIVYSGCAATK